MNRLVPALLLCASCGVVPVSTTAQAPPTFAYVEPHGRPRAWGGGVCPVRGRHEHVYPPVPAAAFVDDNGAWRDTRAIVSFSGPHPWPGRPCTIPRYHQHAAPPSMQTSTATK